jgi:CheY-like chemotaxis protein
MGSQGPRVLLVDDEPRLRAQLGAVLADYGVAVLGEAGTGLEGIELACRLRPDVVLMDLRMPELDGIAATRKLTEVLPSTAPRAWLAYLAAGAVVALACYLVPATGLVPRWAAKIGLYNGLGLSAVAAILVGVRRYRPERPLTWYLFAVGLLSYVTADVIFYTYQDILHMEVSPSVADVFYLASYPFLMAGLLLLIRSAAPAPTGPACSTP